MWRLWRFLEAERAHESYEPASDKKKILRSVLAADVLRLLDDDGAGLGEAWQGRAGRYRRVGPLSLSSSAESTLQGWSARRSLTCGF
jgi:hypothetical protein